MRARLTITLCLQARFGEKVTKTDFYLTATSDTPIVSCVLERLFGEIIRKVRHMPRLVEQQAKAVRWAFILFLCCTCQLSGFGANNSNAVIEWNGVALQCISNTRTGPTIAARALAIAQTSMFDAWTAYEPSSVPAVAFGADSRRRHSQKDLSISLSYAAFRALLNLFPTQSSVLEAEMSELGLSPSDTTDLQTPQGIGNAAAEAVLAAMSNDGSNQSGGYTDTTGYTPVNTPDIINNPDRWQPLRIPDGKGGFVVQSFLRRSGNW